ncbi:hypothetical protein F66182_6184 [Fusarium sp. NRRL 66182]|nr:hypothetical protein F66182_6184 [Fusarium sp. NRRL 66182]
MAIQTASGPGDLVRYQDVDNERRVSAARVANTIIPAHTQLTTKDKRGLFDIAVNYAYVVVIAGRASLTFQEAPRRFLWSHISLLVYYSEGPRLPKVGRNISSRQDIVGARINAIHNYDNFERERISAYSINRIICAAHLRLIKWARLDSQVQRTYDSQDAAGHIKPLILARDYCFSVSARALMTQEVYLPHLLTAA